jgi:hypothetical protein
VLDDTISGLSALGKQKITPFWMPQAASKPFFDRLAKTQ